MRGFWILLQFKFGGYLFKMATAVVLYFQLYSVQKKRLALLNSLKLFKWEVKDNVLFRRHFYFVLEHLVVSATLNVCIMGQKGAIGYACRSTWRCILKYDVSEVYCLMYSYHCVPTFFETL